MSHCTKQCFCKSVFFVGAVRSVTTMVLFLIILMTNYLGYNPRVQEASNTYLHLVVLNATLITKVFVLNTLKTDFFGKKKIKFT